MQTLTYVDFFMAVIGIYMIRMTLKMKKTNTIPNMVLSKEEHLKVKNTKRFIEMIYQKLMIFSIMMTALGAVGMINDELFPIPYFTYVQLVVFFIGFFIFTKAYQDARIECIY